MNFLANFSRIHHLISSSLVRSQLHSSFPGIHNVGYIAILVLLKYEIKERQRNQSLQYEFKASWQVSIFIEIH